MLSDKLQKRHAGGKGENPNLDLTDVEMVLSKRGWLAGIEIGNCGQRLRKQP
jgi:hypothetical protein